MEIDTLKCKKIELVDKNGKPRIILYADEDEGVILLIGDNNPNIQISTNKTKPAQILLTDHLSRPRIIFSVSNNGSAALNIIDEKGYPKVDVGYDAELKKAFIGYNGKALKEIRDHYNNPS